jgi:hypothetical protein
MTHAVVRLSAVVGLFGTTSLSAQATPGRGGFWARIGGSYGSASGSGIWPSSAQSSSGFLLGPQNAQFPGHPSSGASVAAGGTVYRWLRLGGVVSGSWSAENGTESLVQVGAVAEVHPAPLSGLFVALGAGTAFYHGGTWTGTWTATGTYCDHPGCYLIPTEVSEGVGSGSGPGFTVGLGYELPETGHVSVTPVANIFYDFVGNLSPPAGSTAAATGWRQTVVEFGLEVTYH